MGFVVFFVSVFAFSCILSEYISVSNKCKQKRPGIQFFSYFMLTEIVEQEEGYCLQETELTTVFFLLVPSLRNCFQQQTSPCMSPLTYTAFPSCFIRAELTETMVLSKYHQNVPSRRVI